MSAEPVILALDSATEACSVALYRAGKVSETFAIIERGHAEHLLPMAEELLAQTDTALGEIDLFAFGAGPGSFTGLRIGTAMVQGLAVATGKPVVPVSSLAAIAARHRGDVLALIDARMGQVYHGLFHVDDQGLPRPVEEEGVVDPDELAVSDIQELIVAGSGWDQYQDQVSGALEGIVLHGKSNEWPHAADIARLAAHEARHGRVLAAAEALPHYVRNKVARKMGE